MLNFTKHRCAAAQCRVEGLQPVSLQRLAQKQVAQKLEIGEVDISEILRGKIESFALDRLISYAERLYENARVKIIAAKISATSDLKSATLIS